jgi:D-alanyl-D-alanine carboxypeptidase (penicillin-binding protein 5/6)
MFLAAGQRVSLRELILGLAVPSGNDAAVAVALRFAPSVEDFTDLMNREARRLGLVKTRFAEPSGISEYNLTTALEFARFCRIYLEEHPEALGEFHSVPEFAYPKAENVAEQYRQRPGTIFQTNHNRLLGSVEGVDGLKTGYIDEAGYNIALTAERDGTRFIAVILGVPAGLGSRWGVRARDADGEALLTWAFTNFKTVRPEIPEIPGARVWKGSVNRMPLALAGGEPAITVLADRGGGIRCEVRINDLIAPLPPGTNAGEVKFYDSEGYLASVALLTREEIEAGNLFKRIWDSIALFFRRLMRR